MQESSIIQNMLESLAESLTSDEMDRLCEIHLKVGALSGVEPALLQNAFQGVIQNTDFEDVSLHISLVPVTAKCSTCQNIFPMEYPRFICTNCLTDTLDIQTGMELLLDHVIMVENA